MKNLATTAALLVLALNWHSGWAADNEAAKALVQNYYSTANAMELEKTQALFSNEAEINITWKYGSGYPDDEVDTTVAELEKYLDEDAIRESSEMMASYEELSASEEITEISEEKGQIVIDAIQTVKYKIEGYEGTSKQTDVFFLKDINGSLKIIRMESVLEF